MKLLLLAILVYFSCSQLLYPDKLAVYNSDGRKNFNPSLPNHKWDFIVGGGGASGAVEAKRLSSNNKVNVLLLEAGGSDTNFVQHMPAGFSGNFNTDREWNLYTKQQTSSNNRNYKTPAGRSLGGTTTMNAMVYNRGGQEDYDDWCNSGNPGWCWNNLLQYFKKTEYNMNTTLSDYYHGRTGEWIIDEQTYTHDSMYALEQTHINSGMPYEFDQSDGLVVNGKGMTRTVQTFISNGERQSLAEAMLPSTVIARKNLYVQTYANIHKINFDGNKAVEVVYNQTLFLRDSDGKIILNPATNEPQQIIGYELRTARLKNKEESSVILSAGAFGSPKILLHSGVGPQTELENLGISVVQNTPGVGKNAHDHIMLPLIFAVKNTTDSLDTETNLENVFANIIKWATYKGTEDAKRTVNPLTASPVSSNVPELIAFVRRNSSTSTRPDYQIISAPTTFVLDGTVTANMLNQTQCIASGPVILAPKSRGTVKLVSSNPNVPVEIDLGYLTDEDDMNLMLEGIQHVRTIMSLSPIADHILVEALPGSTIQTTEQLKEFIRNYAISGYHYGGTCKMGPASDPYSVVGYDLKVHGLTNVYVADASIMPTMVRANPTSTVVMIGEKLSHELTRRFNLDCVDGLNVGLCRRGIQQ